MANRAYKGELADEDIRSIVADISKILGDWGGFHTDCRLAILTRSLSEAIAGRILAHAF